MIDNTKNSEDSTMKYKSEMRMAENGNLIIHVPMIIRRRRGRKIIIAPNTPEAVLSKMQEVTQNAIIQALIRAFSWQAALETGKIESVSDLARQLKIDGSYVARILKLTALAPDIIEALVNGREPNGLSLAKLVKSFPEDWEEQRKWFGF